MPAPTITLTRVYGPVLLPSGEVPAHGRIRFTLRGWDSDGATMVPAATIEANLDAVGRFEAQIWASLAGARQLAYGVEVTWWSPALRALARQALPDIAVPAVTEVKLKDLLSTPVPAATAPDLLAQAAGYVAEAEAAATDAAGLSQQAIDLVALGSPAVYASIADGITATTEGAFFSVATTTDDSFLILYRHDTGGVATEIARYPSAAVLSGAGVFASTTTGLAETAEGGAFFVPTTDNDGALILYSHDAGGVATEIDRFASVNAAGGGGSGGSALRIPAEGETARLDFARAAGSVAGGETDKSGRPAQLGELRALAFPRIYRRPEGLFGVSPPNTLRRDWAEGASPGALFEPAATVWAPLGNIGASADWTSLGVTLSDTTDIAPIAGLTPRLLTASATDVAANRDIGLMGIALTLEWYQFDLIIKTGVAEAVMLRLPREVGPSGGFGGGGWTVHINLASGLILRNDPDGWVEAAPISVTRIATDTWHLRLRFRPKQTSATEIFYVYAKSADTIDNRDSSFTAGDALFTLGHASVQRCAAPRAPAARVGMDVAVPAERLTLDVGAISADRRTGTFEVRFRLADGFPEDETTIVPIWKIAQTTDPANRGLGVEIAGRAITAVLGRNVIPDTLAIRDVFAREFRVAVSHKDGKLVLAVNGKTASAAFAPQALDEQWQTLFFGDFNAILAGTARPFSGTIGFWRYIPEAMDEGALARLTRPERPIAPGEATPVIVDASGQALMSADGGGRLDFTPGRRAMVAQQGVIDPDGDLPGDAIAARLTGAGDVHFIASSYGAPFGERMQRATRLAAEDGLIVGNRGGPRFEAMWGNGQSLMADSTYGAPVNWPDHPWFLDVADGLLNAVFGFSASGFASDRR